MFADALLDGLYQARLSQGVQQPAGTGAKINQVSVAAACLLLGAEQLDQDLRLAASQLVERVAVRRQIDEPQGIETFRLRTNRLGANASEVPFELTGPSRRRHRQLLQHLPDRPPPRH
jgi:hypothetical protein